jgi:cell shape-determining protein MreD
MRLFVLYIIYGIVAIVIESTWLADMPTASYRLDFLIIAITYLGFSQEWRRAVPIILVYGTLYDVASAGPFGMALCSYLAIYGFIRLIIAKIAYQSLVSRFGWVAIASLMDKAISAALVFMWGYPLQVPEAMITRAPVQALINSIIGLAVIPFLAWYSELTWDTLFRPKKLVLK